MDSSVRAAIADAPETAQNLRHYILGFSAYMREMLGDFDFDDTGHVRLY